MEVLLYITWPWRRSESFRVVYDGDKQPLIDIFSAKTHPAWNSVNRSTDTTLDLDRRLKSSQRPQSTEIQSSLRSAFKGQELQEHCPPPPGGPLQARLH